jgi:hypothetical protein
MIFGSKEPGDLCWINRRPDLGLETSPGDDLAWKMMIPNLHARRPCGFGSTCSPATEVQIPAQAHFQATIVLENHHPISEPENTLRSSVQEDH